MPELILDKHKCLANMERMARKAKKHSLGLRPHCKTHQSAEIGSWFRDFEVSKITVSNLRMAAYFAKAGWEDILVAFPFNPGEFHILKELSERAQISVLIDNMETLPHFRRLNSRIGFYIDVDTGYGRTGIKSDAPDQISRIILESQKHSKLVFSGFYCHAGHSYKTTSQARREQIHLKAISDLSLLKDQFHQYNPKVLYGDTPNCSMQDEFKGIDEITPGNFVFYDLIQRSIGSCTTEQIAVAMACPVVSKYPENHKILIHGGAVHFSKEFLEIDGETVFGQVVKPSSEGWMTSPQASYLNSISQEHGILNNCGELFSQTKIGDKIHILPPHSCLTANLMRQYKTLEGKIITTINS